MNNTKNDCHIRWMIRRDMPEVLAIEEACFAWDAWSEETFFSMLRQRNCIAMLAEHEGRIAGYMVYELHKTRIEIVNFAVAPEFRRRGVGRAMIDKLKAKLSSERRTMLAANVGESNIGGHLFLRAMGFMAKGIEHGFYDDGADAYRFVFRLAANNPEPLAR
jgi:[ribosomal protein S18]-alanine N-acetyltransferase